MLVSGLIACAYRLQVKSTRLLQAREVALAQSVPIAALAAGGRWLLESRTTLIVGTRWGRVGTGRASTHIAATATHVFRLFLCRIQQQQTSHCILDT